MKLRSLQTLAHQTDQGEAKWSGGLARTTTLSGAALAGSNLHVDTAKQVTPFLIVHKTAFGAYWETETLQASTATMFRR